MDSTSIVGRFEDGVYKYKCLEKDVGKLPKNDIPTGSTCYVIDTGDLLMYEASTEQWFAQ